MVEEKISRSCAGDTMTEIIFEMLENYPSDCPIPKYESDCASGMDVRAANSYLLWPGKTALIKTGLKVEIPKGFELQVRPRSGLALKHGITVLNAPGTIDQDYRDEIGVLLINHGGDTFTIERGDRIAQLVLSRVEKAIPKVGVVKETSRKGGFGSTGV